MKILDLAYTPFFLIGMIQFMGLNLVVHTLIWTLFWSAILLFWFYALKGMKYGGHIYYQYLLQKNKK